MKRINIKQEYKDYCFHKERIQEDCISYVRYWDLRVIEWKTQQELLEYKKYWSIKREYDKYKSEWWTLLYWWFFKRLKKWKKL
jgi:hypothetical protein